MDEIKIIPETELGLILPLIQRLNPNIDKTLLAARLKEMKGQGYRCAGLFFDGQLVGICGFWIMTKFYVGKHIEPDNVFVLPEYRRQGRGKKLLEWVLDYGKSQSCVASELNCYISNTTGNAFWEQQGLVKIGYHYQKSLK